jgi:hypothetical protein
MDIRTAMLAPLFFALTPFPGARAVADTRTIESPFALSADARSEYAAQFQVFSPGRLLIEATWTAGEKGAKPSPLRLTLSRPQGGEAARKEGASPLRLEYTLAQSEIGDSGAKWGVRIINDVAGERSEVTGKLRITIPTASSTLEDTQFTLLGAGNAQEIPARVPAPGRVIIEAEWVPDPLVAGASEQPQLTLSLIHPGLDKTYARRVGKSGLRIEQQITEQELERGRRVTVRIQNDGATRVKGRIKVSFFPSL